MAQFIYPQISVTTAAGAATEAKQDSMITELQALNTDTDTLVAVDYATQTTLAVVAGDTTSLDAKVPSQGAALTASSLPVNIASDQTVPVSASSLPLPTGAATETTLSTVAGDTTSLDAKVPSQGAALTASSLPVNIASDQTVPVSAASLPLPTGAATETKQDSIITELQALNTDTDTLVAVDYATQTTLSAQAADIGLLEDRLSGSLVPEAYDYIATTYVAAGNGAGEIETVTYKTGGSGGTTVATLTLAYDGSDRLSSVTRS